MRLRCDEMDVLAMRGIECRRYHPPARQSMTGSRSATATAARQSRYGTRASRGKPKPINRGTVPLVIDNDANRQAIADRDRAAREKKLVERVLAGKARSDAEDAESVAIRRRWAAEAEARRSA
jgi:hypothetical protein